VDDDERVIERDPEDDPEGEDVVVPWERLSGDALRGVIEEYVTREGTDYGHTEVSLADKVAAVRRQLTNGEVVVLFDGKTKTVDLLTAREARARGIVLPRG
jgi:uncharacterized protein YheU (UPF0270 family)